MNIEDCTLLQFIEQRKSDGIDLAKICADCDATDFITPEQHGGTRQISPDTLEAERLADSLYIAHIPQTAYVMYEENDSITGWVCYALPDHRKHGHMHTLLKYIKAKYPDQQILIDTYNKSLIKMMRDLGITHFRERARD